MAGKSRRDISEILSDPNVLVQAAREAARDAIKQHKQMGLPLAVWRNGAVAWVAPEELEKEEGTRPEATSPEGLLLPAAGVRALGQYNELGGTRDAQEVSMEIVMQGVVHGKTIELETSPGIEDGRRVELVVRLKQRPAPPPAWKPGSTETAAGMMAGYWTEEDDRILETIERDRKQAGQARRA